MAFTVTRKSARSNRLTYFVESDGYAAAPHDLGTRTNAQLLADFKALYDNWKNSPLYQALEATYADEAALADLLGDGVRVFVRPASQPTVTKSAAPATYVSCELASLALTAPATAPILAFEGPPQMGDAATPYAFFLDIEYGWSGKGA